MKRYQSLLILLVVFLMAVTAQAQQPRGGPGQRGAGPVVAEAYAQELAVADRWVRVQTADTAWWTNTALVARLGLSDAQKTRIETTFEAHRQNLVSSKEQLEKEEAQLARLLQAETVDRAGVFTQINRVTQARGEMERNNATMTLEMREHLTRTQWLQLQGVQPQPLALTAVSAGPPPAGPIRIGGDVAQANLISQVKANYPALARAARVQDYVMLQTTISKEGRVLDLKILHGHPLLNEAAIEAVKQWRYRPQLMNGQPVDVITTVNVNFSFQ